MFARVRGPFCCWVGEVVEGDGEVWELVSQGPVWVLVLVWWIVRDRIAMVSRINREIARSGL